MSCPKIKNFLIFWEMGNGTFWPKIRKAFMLWGKKLSSPKTKKNLEWELSNLKKKKNKNKKILVLVIWNFLDSNYVSITSDHCLVRSVTIHHFLQANGNRNVVGSIRHVSCFHLERYNKMIKIVYYVIHINFPIKSVDSCWREAVNMKFMEKYIKLRITVKIWGLKNIKTKNFLADWRKVKCQEKVLLNLSGLTMTQ